MSSEPETNLPVHLELNTEGDARFDLNKQSIHIFQFNTLKLNCSPHNVNENRASLVLYFWIQFYH